MPPVKKSFRRKAFSCALLACLSALPAASVTAQDYPSRPVKVIVPWAAGGSTDILTRIVAQKLSESLRQPFVVENRAGATGAIGTTQAARAPADGYTLLMAATAPNSILPNLSTKLSYDAAKDFSSIARIGTTGYVLAVLPTSPAKSIKDLVTVGKAKPGDLTFSSPGEGSPIHLSGELFKSATGVEMLHVPFTSSPAATMEVMSGRVTMTFDNIAPILPHLKSGRLKALGITTPKRSALLPDVPTIAESGYPGFESVGWFGLMAPSGTPRAIIELLNRETVRILKLPEVREQMLGLGVENLGSTPQELDEFSKSELAKWGKVVKAANVKVN